jgi:hypothetical protein
MKPFQKKGGCHKKYVLCTAVVCVAAMVFCCYWLRKTGLTRPPGVAVLYVDCIFLYLLSFLTLLFIIPIFEAQRKSIWIGQCKLILICLLAPYVYSIVSLFLGIFLSYTLGVVDTLWFWSGQELWRPIIEILEVSFFMSVFSLVGLPMLIFSEFCLFFPKFFGLHDFRENTTVPFDVRAYRNEIYQSLLKNKAIFAGWIFVTMAMALSYIDRLDSQVLRLVAKGAVPVYATRGEALNPTASQPIAILSPQQRVRITFWAGLNSKSGKERYCKIRLFVWRKGFVKKGDHDVISYEEGRVYRNFCGGSSSEHE